MSLLRVEACMPVLHASLQKLAINMVPRVAARTPRLTNTIHRLTHPCNSASRRLCPCARITKTQLSVGFYSLQTCLDIIQSSADPSASFPRAKRSLPRTSAAHVFHCLLPQTFRGAWFTSFASASIGAETNVILSEVVFRSLCRLGLHWATHATWPLACKHTLPRSFREASVNLPRSTPAVLAFLACCWHLLFE